MRYIFLSQQFYNDYAGCSEIEQKLSRPYVQIIVQVSNIIFAVPLRSNINHPYVFWTDKANKCGVDYSKAVILTDTAKYIDSAAVPHLRQNEFNALRGKEYMLKTGLEKYIAKYKKALTNRDVPSNDTLCRFSTLQYFEEYLEDI